jgi:hypothetical protein
MKETHMEKTERELTLILHCRHLPGTECAGKSEVRLGIQKGTEVIEDVPADTEEVRFTVPLRILQNTQTAQTDFRGPFVQGKAGDRFLYLSWGQRQGERFDMFRRAKFPLRHLDRPRIAEALKSGKPVEAFVDMTDPKGMPLTATIHEESFQWREKNPQIDTD